MPKGIGIQQKDNQIIVAVVEDTGKTLVLAQLHCLTTANWQTDLTALFRRQRFDPYQVVAAVSTQEAILRKFPVPFIQAKQIEQVVAFEAEQYIQTIPIEELVLDYHILKVEENSTRVLAAALPRPIVQNSIAQIEACEIYPSGIDLDIAGLLYMTQTVPLPGSDGGIILLDVRNNTCNVLVLFAGQIEEARAVRLNATSEAATDLRATTALAMPLFRQEGMRRTEFITLGAKAQVFLRLIKELRRTMFEAQTLEALYVSGDPDMIEYLPIFLGKRLQVPVRPWDIAPTFGIAPGVEQKNVPVSIPAIGLALKALGKSSGGFNFRKHEFASQRGLQIVQQPLAIALTLLALFLLIVGIQISWRYRAWRSEYDRLLDEAQAVYRRIAPPDSFPPLAWNKRIYHVRSVIQERLDEAKEQLPPIPDVTAYWAAITQKVTEVRQNYYLTIDRLRITASEAMIEGRTESDLCFDLLKTKLRQIPAISPGSDSVQLVVSQLQESPTNPKLARVYKFIVKFKE